MKKLILIIICILLLNPLFSDVVHKTSKGLTLLAAEDEIANVAIRTISSQILSQNQGMPFRIRDKQSYFNTSSGNPSNGSRIIARWDLISNRSFKVKISAKPLLHEYDSRNDSHVTQPSTDDREYSKQEALYFLLAFRFSFSYLNNSNQLSTISGYYVFEPNKSIDNTGSTIVYLDSGSVIRSGASSVTFSDFARDYQQSTAGEFLGYVGSMDQPIYFGFTNDTTEYIKSTDYDSGLADGLYTTDVTVEIILE